MPSYILCLTEAEAYDPINLGYGFIKAHEDRLVQFATSIVDDVTGGDFDAARTYFVYDGLVYFIHKNYIDIDNNRRVYIVKPSVLGADLYEYPTEDSEDSGD